ncbi:MAG: 30S ribosomal protein S12 methylthiotransferase RimO [Treponema sp.]|jgi:ribosomal protein S12 methylthiotransferase|nr:30S ribosomal protein S12 methylthiotransferase RimO [Treponema sp.]
MTYYIDPFGCVKNQVDAETMMSFLNQAGWETTEDAGAADLIIVNSCGFIESAKQESINAVLAWRRLYPEKKILLAGCLAQRYAAELSEALPEADLLFGNTDLSGIAEAAAKAAGNGRETGEPERADTEGAPDAGLVSAGKRPLLSLPGSAYVKISEGCDNRCSFCAIPLIRGGLKSRAVSGILDECKALLDRGIKELCIIGQDIGSYKPGLPALLEEIAKLEGGFWVRLLYIHPDHFPFPILDIMERDSRFLPYFDIPFQHGSEKILRLMNRRGNAETYLALIETIRSRLPDAAVRSAFMTGFPGETQEDFRALLDFQEKARLDWMGCFAYSREEGTPAYSMKRQVAKKTAAERKRILEEQQIPISEKQMDRFIGKDLPCIVEERIEGEEGLYLGRLPCQAPDVDGAAVISNGAELRPGDLVRCRVFARAGFDLEVKV